MKPQLAMRLLADLMGWDNDDSKITSEFAWLRLIAEYKYDHYQGFNPGSRFFVNLLSWIGQFNPSDRQEAYNLIRSRLVYINQREMHHLVSLTIPRIQREARKAVADELGIQFFKTWGSVKAEQRIRLMAIRTLYIGLSDGARIDVFRRDNEGVISNEQVVAASEISAEKWNSLQAKLKARLSAENFQDEQPLFEQVCLIDDFTASGTTLIRLEANGWDGKVPKFCTQNQTRFGTHIHPKCVLHIHHYIGSEGARYNIESSLVEFQKTVPDITFSLTFSTVLRGNLVIGENGPPSLVSLLKRYYGKSIETTHLDKNIWFGYKDCGLPVILEHNTPNNSIALLWATSRRPDDDSHAMKPLFSRKQRHVDHG